MKCFTCFYFFYSLVIGRAKIYHTFLCILCFNMYLLRDTTWWQQLFNYRKHFLEPISPNDLKSNYMYSRWHCWTLSHFHRGTPGFVYVFYTFIKTLFIIQEHYTYSMLRYKHVVSYCYTVVTCLYVSVK